MDFRCLHCQTSPSFDLADIEARSPPVLPHPTTPLSFLTFSNPPRDLILYYHSLLSPPLLFPDSRTFFPLPPSPLQTYSWACCTAWRPILLPGVTAATSHRRPLDCDLLLCHAWDYVPAGRRWTKTLTYRQRGRWERYPVMHVLVMGDPVCSDLERNNLDSRLIQPGREER